MRARPSTDPARWRQIPPGAGGVEAEIGAAVRAAASAPPWDDLRVAHIRQTVLRSGPLSALGSGPLSPLGGERVRERGLALPRRPTWAIAVGCLLLGAAATAMAGYAFNHLRRPAAPAAIGGAPAPASGRRHAFAGRPRLDAPPVTEEVPAPSLLAPPFAPTGLAPPAAAAALALPPAVAPASKRASLRLSAAAPSRARASIAPPAEAPPAGEGEQLSEALRLLRAERDAPAALARLDDYEARHPKGTLAREAALARVEALLALGRDTAALDVLDGMTLDSADVDRGVALARAELRAAAGRCADAAADFARARRRDGDGGGDADDPIAARALFGEGVCDQRTGDRRAARAAFETYRRRFPNGPRRADVDRALADLGS